MDSDVRARPEISRRRVISGIAWSVPVIAAVSATPAFAASGSGGGTTPQPLPSQAVEELSVSCFSAWNESEGGKRGPIGWAGGQIGWWNGGGGVASGVISWVVTLTTPSGATSTIVTGASTITRGDHGKIELKKQKWGTAPLEAGTYTITLTVTGAAGASKSASTSITLE